MAATALQAVGIVALVLVIFFILAVAAIVWKIRRWWRRKYSPIQGRPNPSSDEDCQDRRSRARMPKLLFDSSEFCNVQISGAGVRCGRSAYSYSIKAYLYSVRMNIALLASWIVDWIFPIRPNGRYKYRPRKDRENTTTRCSPQGGCDLLSPDSHSSTAPDTSVSEASPNTNQSLKSSQPKAQYSPLLSITLVK